MLPLLVLLGTIAGAWYLLIVRPQRDQQTRHGAVLAQLQLGDHVLTVGGIYGRIVAIEGPTVVIELAPGLTSRIASDGIARIVQGPEASLPMAPAPAPTAAPPPAPPPPPPPPVPNAASHPVHSPATTMDHSMQQPPHPQYPQPLVAHDGQGTTTLRAHVLPAAPVLAQPWRDVAPTATQQPYGTVPVQQPYGQQPPAPMPQGGPVMHPGGPVMPQAAPTMAYAAPMHAAPMPPQAMHAPPPPQPWAPAPVAARPDFLPPPPVLQPFASVRIAPEALHAQPVAHAPQPIQQLHQVATTTQLPVTPHVASHGIPAPQLFARATPAVAPAAVQPYVQVHHAAEAPIVEAPRRASQAPKGMGSSLRLDDPSLRDTMERARSERESLAAEYRQLVAPLVDTSVQVAAAPAAPQQYPGPARSIAMDSQGDHGMPRPHVQAPSAHVDPALQGAFQHRTPYGMTQPATQQAVPAVVHA